MKAKALTKIGILGFGRFGNVLYSLLKDDFELVLYDSKKKVFENKSLSKTTMVVSNLHDLKIASVIFICTPINTFEDVVSKLAKHLDGQLLVDVLSVKTYPANVFKKYSTKYSFKAMLTHPMFGPDSSKNGFQGLPIVLSNLTAENKDYEFWKSYFQAKELKIVELSPSQHDRLAANSQGLAHFIGRVLEEFNFKATPIDTFGAKKLQDIMEQTCNDTYELFSDLQTYNPYTKQMRIKLGKALELVYNKLLPNAVSDKYVTYGIQGGRGSFNEEALNTYINGGERHAKYKIKYLYTTQNVLESLTQGTIDFGLFAVSNTLGGIVDETINVLGNYKFRIVDQITINIRHFLMKRKDTEQDLINHIIAHPQVLKQCEKTLALKYPKLQKLSGTGAYIDTAKAAEGVATGKLDKFVYILGPAGLGTLYGFDVVDSNLQDHDDNRTTFLLVARH